MNSGPSPGIDLTQILWWKRTKRALGGGEGHLEGGVPAGRAAEGLLGAFDLRRGGEERRTPREEGEGGALEG